MSEVRLNLIDFQQILQGTVHGSIADACVAALSAEPETIAELNTALARYIKPTGEAADQTGHFNSFRSVSDIDERPWDAGVVIIDLAARMVAAESTYSQPGREGEVRYHDGTKSTDVPVIYRVSDEWVFLNSIVEYQSAQHSRRRARSKPPLDARKVLYGKPLVEFIVNNIWESSICRDTITKLRGLEPVETTSKDSDQQSREEEERLGEALGEEISAIHGRWLTTSLTDLEDSAPRDVLLAKKEFIDFDMHTRCLQWSFQGEGPPCLANDSHAYRFAGFGIHECVIYYELARLLLWTALDHQPLDDPNAVLDHEGECSWLEQTKKEWLESPHRDFDDRIPAILIENERRRLPITLQAKDMIIDDNCPACLASARAVEMGYGPGFWHLDGSNMDEGFAFSFARTREEWEAEKLRQEEFDKEFDRKWKEKEARVARGEKVDDDWFDWKDPLDAEPASVLSESDDRDDESKLVQ